MKRHVYIILFLCSSSVAFSQRPGFSIATDLDIQRSFLKNQQYWAAGQTMQLHFHIDRKEEIYAWVAYYAYGKFSNQLSAPAKSSSTIPQQVSYVNNAQMRFKHVSVGWKHYIKGAYNIDRGWSIYSYAGFGLMMGRIVNTHSIGVDTSLYILPVLNGKAHFKRLTLDLGLGWEKPLGGDIFFYSEFRLWVPTTDYPSQHILVNNNAPLDASLNFGVRILIN